MKSTAISEVPGPQAVSVCPQCFSKISPRRQYLLENRPELREPCILSWDQRSQLLEALPIPLKGIVLFMLNTGCREKEACNLQWAWERTRPGLKASAFKIPVDDGSERWVILNDEAQAIIEQQRGLHSTHVFINNGRPFTRIKRYAWKRAGQALGLPELRVHDLRRTVEEDLKVAGVSVQDRQSILGRFMGIDDSNKPLEYWIAIANKLGRPLEQGLSC